MKLTVDQFVFLRNLLKAELDRLQNVKNGDALPRDDETRFTCMRDYHKCYTILEQLLDVRVQL